MNPQDPFDGGHGHREFAESAFSIWPALGLILLLLVLATTAWILWRRGTLNLPPITPRSSPEDHAKQVLADRFARGDIDSEEFLTRASILNWTPGIDPAPSLRRRI